MLGTERTGGWFPRAKSTQPIYPAATSWPGHTTTALQAQPARAMGRPTRRDALPSEPFSSVPVRLRELREQPISRILSRATIPLGDTSLCRSSNLPEGFRRPRSRERGRGPRWRTGPARTTALWTWPSIPFLFGLAPCGVYPAAAVTSCAVRSYRTFSPLPAIASAAAGGIFSVALAVSRP